MYALESPYFVARRIERPIPLVCYQCLNLRDIQSIRLEPRSNNIRVRRVHDEILCEGSAEDLIIERTVAGNIEWLRQDAALD